MMWKCWFFHKWGKWEPYVERGVTYPRWGGFAGKEIKYLENRQKRVCERCGEMEDKAI